ncbi:50S ribosomal protein L9 [Buchnera aphidicola]|uniref:Large ribosomal subunit protein bL9 n=1 Tax=Buchnera aphidicola (Stegophylla sp.) TaxID=2315800 RepID=A0A4D6YJ78_9GAMM|nr:50S ribosomal protein L9 [Buchnera aphidicola (Stegophylla sp.)]QCI26511.1 50S ribosomal protein L9 [Buchnera aphidicola (Stegophylla sp.)]
MEIILLKDIRNVGKIGSIITVKSGYARNYLIPLGQALRSSSENINIIQNKKNQLDKKVKFRISQAKLRLNQVKSLPIIKIYVRSRKHEKLFGSIGPKDIANAIMKLGVQVDKQEIYIKNGYIRKLGVYKVIFRPYKTIETSCLVHVLSQNSI